jgi:hypothetical protein
MRGDPQTNSARWVPTFTRPRWFRLVTRGRRRTKEEELELIERLGRLEREARRSGAYVAKPEHLRRWC